MELHQISNASIFYGADGTFDLIAGEKFKIDKAGVKQFEEECPTGKKWTVIVSMKIEEEAA